MIRIMILVVALLSGGITWWLFTQTGGLDRTQVAAVAPVATVDVLVYSSDLRRGTLLSADVLRWQPQVRNAVPSGAITREARPEAVAELSGSVLKTSVLASDAVRETELASGRAGFMSLVVAPDMRAISIPIDEDKSAGGFILPNDRVDVIHTVVRDDDGDGVSNGVSRTILYNVRVLAIGQVAAENTVKQTAKQQKQLAGVSSDTVVLGDTATLEVTEEQANILAAAAASGDLTLALRAMSDDNTPRIGDLSGFEGSNPTGSSFVVYRGATAEVVKCQNGCDTISTTSLSGESDTMAPGPAPLPATGTTSAGSANEVVPPPSP